MPKPKKPAKPKHTAKPTSGRFGNVPFKLATYSFMLETLEHLNARFPAKGEKSAFVDNAVREKLGLPPRAVDQRVKPE